MPARFSTLEKKILEELSENNLIQHVREISKYDRMSGSEDETRAVDYVAKKLESYGINVQQYRFEAYVGRPESAEVQVLSPDNRKILGVASALTPSCQEGMVGELIYVGPGDEDSFARADVRGKVLLIDGIAEPEIAKRADEKDAVGEIFINDENPHEGTVSVVWGTPRWETAHLLPATPCVSINQNDGEYLKTLVKNKPVEVKVTTHAWRGWTKLPVLIGTIPGRAENRFTLLSGHIDSWYYGAMDNATANAMVIEVGRVMSKNRRALRRGLKLAFWSGHSHARFSGSTMYADNFWGELEKGCIAHVNADSIGSQAATVLTEAAVMPETRDLAAAAVAKITHQELSGHAFSRMGDQSFWGIGIPSVFNSLSEIPTDSEVKTVSLFGPSPTGIGWWWHTVYDTSDKIDSKLLLRDTKVYALVTLALCTDLIIPLNYYRTATELKNQLSKLKTTGPIDLRLLRSKTEILRRKLGDLNALSKRKSLNEKRAELVNSGLIRLSRILVPIMQTRSGRFDHDLAVSIPPVPCLEQVRKLAELDPSTDEFKFRTVGARRDLNQLYAALDEAIETVDSVFRNLRRA